MKRLPIALSFALVASCASSPPPAAKPAAGPAIVAKPTTKAAPKKPAPVDPWANRTDLLAPPKTALDTKVSLGTIERYTMPNGAQVILVPRKSAPVINVTVGFRGGRLAEPADRAGLATFVSLMLRKGTQKRTADQISNDLESRGATIGAGASTDTVSVRCAARSTELDLCLDNVADLTLRPLFPEKELAEVRTQLLASVAARRDSPAAISDMHWRNQLFGEEDPRGRPISPRSLGAIDRAQLQRYHRDTFLPKHAVIAITGDFDPKTIRGRLTKVFGAWKGGTASVAKVTTIAAPAQLTVRVIDKPDATQAAIVMAGPAFASSSPDFPAATLMNYAFGGGGFSSRLMQIVRSEGGKTYGIRSRFEIGRSGGAVAIATATRTDEVGATLTLINNELAKLRASGITDAELTKAKANLIGGYGLGLETAADTGDAILSAELDGQGPSFVIEWPSRLDKVTVEDAARVGAKYLTPVVLTITGNRAAILPQLEKLGLSPAQSVSYTESVSAKERALDAAPPAPAASAPAASTPAASTPAVVAKAAPVVDAAAAKLLGAAYQQKGGVAADKVNYLVQYGHGEMTVGGKRVAVKVVERYWAPSRVRVDMTIANQTLVQVLGDKGGFLENGGRHQDLPAPLLAEMRRAYWREPCFVLGNAHREGKDVRIENGLLDVTTPAGDRVQLKIDPKTNDLLEVQYTEEGKRGVDKLSDYRAVEGAPGVRAPFHAVRFGPTGDVLDITYDKIVTTETPDPKQF